MPIKRSNKLYWFKEVDKDDASIVGSKAANFGEMIQAGFPVPPGFIISSKAYFHFIKENNLTTKINHLLRTINFDHPESLLQVSSHIKNLILHEQLSPELIQEIFYFYKSLGGVLEDPYVSLRASLTAEDIPTNAFVGQPEMSIHLKGEANLIMKVKEAWASLFDARAIYYRHEQQFDHFRVGIAVVIQSVLEADHAGIMFTIDPVTNDKDKIIIEAAYGLSDYILNGKVTPDHYVVEKEHKHILKRVVATQDVKLQMIKGQALQIAVSPKDAKKQKLLDEEIIALADLGKRLEKHYYFPQDIEWAIVKGRVYVTQSRAVTTLHSKKVAEEVSPSAQLPLILKGTPASPGLASGPVKLIHTLQDLHAVMRGDIIVTTHTNPDYLLAMKKAAAIITEKGGRTSHAAIVSRELGIPAVVGTENALTTLKSGAVITVNGSKGEIYKGATFLTSTAAHNADEHMSIKTATKVYVNIAEPELASSIAAKNVDGVGLLRAEFMMAGIGVHPKKLIREGKKQFFIDKLASQLEIFCNAFNPRPVVYRASDFKTSDYRGLIGGREFEPMEPNPLLGYRGAFRYIHDPEVFKLELEAIKIVRQKKNLKNLWLMVPFVRTVRELVEVKKIINDAGLQRSPLFRLWMMVEVPSNVILLEEFIKVGIDGISIGTNDLTMLMLGTDRDNSEVARAYSEQNPAVLWALEHAIKTAHKNHITSSVSGEAVSLYPELLEKLLAWGVTSVSVFPDVVPTVRQHISKLERQMVK